MPIRDPEFLRRLLATFRIEAEEHLRAMASGLIDLEREWATGQQAEIVETIFREAHSLKGAARAVNFTDIETLCQLLESIFAAFQRQELGLSAALLDLLHQAVNMIGVLLANQGRDLPAAERTRFATLVRQLRNPPKEEETHALPASVDEIVSLPPPPVPETLDVVAEEPAPPAVLPAGRVAPEERPAPAETIRISAARLDELQLQVEELAAARQASRQRAIELSDLHRSFMLWRRQWAKTEASVRASRALAVANPGWHGEERRNGQGVNLLELIESNHSLLLSLEERLAALADAAERDNHLLDGMIDRLVHDMKQILMSPFSSILELLPKVARDLARDQAKDVQMVIAGADIEVERRILQEIKDPLLHLVRNCVDHGIEKPAERVARQKPAVGTISITVKQREDGKVELRVMDDGSGIDLSKVRDAALRMRLISGESAAALDEDALSSLVFHSGLSTSPIITDLSGRGLGLTIVREKVEKLGGEITVESEPGVGTTFCMVLPVTTAAMRGILVDVQNQRFAFPATYVERVMRVRSSDIETVENRETIRVEDQVVAVARLEQVLQLRPRPETQIGLPTETQNLYMVVVNADGRRMAFAVDEIVGEQEILIKSLGPQLARVRNIAGATVLGSGQIVPILHVSDLLKSAIVVLSAPPSRTDTALTEETPTRVYSILVVEDSITARIQLQSILELAGYDVQTATDGMDALMQLRSGRFDLVVSDVGMPRLNGFDLVARIRADARLAHLPVVLVTALDSPQDRERGIDVGADAYIVKSDFDQSNLLDVIRRLL